MRTFFLVTVIALLFFMIVPAFAYTQELTGNWIMTEISYKGVNIPTEKLASFNIKNNVFFPALEIKQDGTCILFFEDIVYPAVISPNSSNSYLLSVENNSLELEINRDGSITVALNKELLIRLEKTENSLNISDYHRIEDVLEEEERKEEFHKVKEDSATLAVIKPATIYDMKVTFSEEDTEKMSAFMLYGRYYFDGNTMIGMAYDKSGTLPNLVKTTISVEENTPKQEAFTVLDRHVNANFLTVHQNELYYIRVDRDSGYSSLARLNLITEEVVSIGDEMHEMAYLQLHDERLWYTGDEHHLYSCKLNGKDNRIELDKAVYDPYFLTDNWLIYQDEADGETFHLWCIMDGTDLKITESRSFNPIVVGSYLYFTSIPDDGGKAYLSRTDLSKPVKDSDLCYIIETSDLSMSKSFYIDNSTIYGENGSSADINNWMELTNTAWLSISERYFFIGDQYMIYGEIYSEHETVLTLYLYDRNSGNKSLFRHVY